MRKIIFNTLRQTLQRRYYTPLKYEYEMPEDYRNSFYLANASLENSTNWFLHDALGVIYSDLIYEFTKSKKYTVANAKSEITNVMNLIDPCTSLIELQFPLRMNNGSFQLFKGFRVEHGAYIHNRPCLGGLRLCPNLIKSDIRALASLSTFKHACMNIDMLGAHGGILVSPNALEENELQMLVETYIHETTKRGFCGETNVYEPDLNCDSTQMKWVVAAHAKAKGSIGNVCAVGKAETYGGVKYHEKAVAHGILCGLDLFLHNAKIMEKVGLEEGWVGKTFIIQGLGRVGACTATYLALMGLKCVGIIEHDCHVYDFAGLNVSKAELYKNTHGTLNGFLGKTKTSEPFTTLTSKCDILVLAAMQRCLPYHLANQVKASIVVEAANCPIPPSVHKILLGRHKLVLPDIFINAGSSVASYLEYLKNSENLCLSDRQTVSDDLYRTIFKERREDLSEKKFYSPILRWHHMGDRIGKCEVSAAVDYITRQTAEEIVRIVELYKLGLDLRCAAYIKGIQKLFWTAYKNNK